MRSIKLAIINNKKQDIDCLIEIIHIWSNNHRCTVDIVSFDNGLLFLEKFVTDSFNLIFIDSYLEGLSSIETIQQLRAKDSQIPVVFCSANDELILQAVHLHLFDFLKKPYTYKKLSYVLDEFIKIFHGPMNTLSFTCGKKEIALNPLDIMYIVADNNYTIFTIQNGTARYRIFFSKVAELLDPKQFIVCSRGVAINFKYVKKLLDGTFEMIDGEKFAVRRNGRKDIIDAYKHYILEK